MPGCGIARGEFVDEDLSVRHVLNRTSRGMARTSAVVASRCPRDACNIALEAGSGHYPGILRWEGRTAAGGTVHGHRR